MAVVMDSGLAALRRPGMTGNAMTTSSITGLLQNVSGTLVLVGAGKMGGAMLAGWVRLGLPRAQIVVLEPRPSPEIEALAKLGVRLNPATDAIGNVAFIVVAIKPQEAEAIATTMKATFPIASVAG